MRHRLTPLTLVVGLIVAAPFAPSTAQAQQQANPNVGQFAAGLINVQLAVAGVNVDISDVVDIGDITDVVDIGDITLNDVDVVDIETVNVEDVLNNNQINVLNILLERNDILSHNQDILNDLLREAEIITDNQVVVGILGGVVYVLDLT